MDNTTYCSWGMEVCYPGSTSMNPKSSIFSQLFRRKLKYFVLQRIQGSTVLNILEDVDSDFVYVTSNTYSSWLQKVRTGWFCCKDFLICPQLLELHTIWTCWHFWRNRELKLLCLVPGSMNKPSPECSSLHATYSVQWYHSSFEAQRLFAQVHLTFTDDIGFQTLEFFFTSTKLLHGLKWVAISPVLNLTALWLCPYWESSSSFGSLVMHSLSSRGLGRCDRFNHTEVRCTCV